MLSKIAILALFVALSIFLYQRFSGGSALEANQAAGAAFMSENRNAEGVKETASGLQYLVLESNGGDIQPTPSDQVRVHYHGTLIDGTVFDSSVERDEPIVFGLNQVIKGWTEGVPLMHVGDKFRFFIPPELAYGNRRAGPIGPGTTLIFDVELLAVNP